jgi:hypothetical protein
MGQVSLEAIIFMAIGWAVVLSLTIFPMKKILSKRISYDESNDKK